MGGRGHAGVLAQRLEPRGLLSGRRRPPEELHPFAAPVRQVRCGRHESVVGAVVVVGPFGAEPKQRARLFMARDGQRHECRAQHRGDQPLHDAAEVLRRDHRGQTLRQRDQALVALRLGVGQRRPLQRTAGQLRHRPPGGEVVVAHHDVLVGPARQQHTERDATVRAQREVQTGLDAFDLGRRCVLFVARPLSGGRGDQQDRARAQALRHGPRCVGRRSHRRDVGGVGAGRHHRPVRRHGVDAVDAAGFDVDDLGHVRAEHGPGALDELARDVRAMDGGGESLAQRGDGDVASNGAGLGLGDLDTLQRLPAQLRQRAQRGPQIVGRRRRTAPDERNDADELVRATHERQ